MSARSVVPVLFIGYNYGIFGMLAHNNLISVYAIVTLLYMPL